MASNEQEIDLDQDVFDGDEEKYDGKDNGLVAAPKLSGELVDYRVTYKGHGKIFTGEATSKGHAKHPKGRIVRVDRSIAEDLQERGYAEILEGSDTVAPAPAPKPQEAKPEVVKA